MKARQQTSKHLFVIGIDEVGRGSLAGPLVVGAVALKRDFKPQDLLKGVPFKDSKRLSPSLREAWYKEAKKKGIPFVFCKISPAIIDKKNVSKATQLAAKRCLNKLFKKYKYLSLKNSKIMLDGGIFLKDAKTIVKGDEKIAAIKLASVLAKVERDKIMIKFSRKYPAYNFLKNKGYGTKEHLIVLQKFGMTKIHRWSFCKNYLINNNNRKDDFSEIVRT